MAIPLLLNRTVMLRRTTTSLWYKAERKLRYDNRIRRHKHHPDGEAPYMDQSKQYIRRDGERWWVLDCAGEELKQIAEVAAAYLVGLHRPDFRPGTITGDHVVALNTKDVVMVGDYWLRVPFRVVENSPWPAGKFNVRSQEVFDRDPSLVVWKATHQALREYFAGNHHPVIAPMERLWLYEDALHPHQDMAPRPIEWTSDKHYSKYVPHNHRIRWRYNQQMR